MSPTSPPRLPRQNGVRTTFRVVGILLLAPAGWWLQAGFLGAASRNDADASFCDRCGAARAR